MERFLTTDPTNRILFAQRLVLAAVMLPHGAQKLLGLFGGHGFEGTMGYFTGSLGIPAPIALLVILGESFGPILLALGLGTRLAAFGVTAIMLGAAATHVPYGFFMDWFGAQGGEGFEYHLLALALSVPLLIAGGGAAALDTVLARRLGKAARTPSLAAV